MSDSSKVFDLREKLFYKNFFHQWRLNYFIRKLASEELIVAKINAEKYFLLLINIYIFRFENRVVQLNLIIKIQKNDVLRKSIFVHVYFIYN